MKRKLKEPKNLNKKSDQWLIIDESADFYSDEQGGPVNLWGHISWPLLPIRSPICHTSADGGESYWTKIGERSKIASKGS